MSNAATSSPACRKADGLILVDAHPGNPVNGIEKHQSGGHRREPARLDSIPTSILSTRRTATTRRGPSTYSDEFKKKIFQGPGRADEPVDRQGAGRCSAQMKEGKYLYPDDDAFLIVRGRAAARSMQLDLSIHHGTQKPRKLLKNDGTIVTADRRERPGRQSRSWPPQNATFENGTPLSDRQVVSERQRHARRPTPWTASITARATIHRPATCRDPRAAAGDGDGRHYFIRDNEIHYELAGAARQGLRRLRRRRARTDALRAVRIDARAILEFGEEFLRLRCATGSTSGSDRA